MKRTNQTLIVFMKIGTICQKLEQRRHIRERCFVQTCPNFSSDNVLEFAGYGSLRPWTPRAAAVLGCFSFTNHFTIVAHGGGGGGRGGELQRGLSGSYMYQNHHDINFSKTNFSTATTMTAMMVMKHRKTLIVRCPKSSNPC